MTSSAGPGLSLMAEFAGLGYYAEVPAVVFDIQRCGPSTGLPTRTGQQDILSTALLSHGDSKHPLLIPSSIAECYSMAMDAFDLAERLQTPVFVMSDLDLGMNYWMSEPLDYPDRPLDRAAPRYRDAQADRRVRPLQGRRWRRHPVPDRAAGRHARLLRERVRTQRARDVQRARRRLRQQPDPPGTQVRHCPHARTQTCRRVDR